MNVVIDVGRFLLDHWQVLAAIGVALFGKRHVDQRKIDKTEAIAREVFTLVEEWAKANKSTGSQKRDVALGQLRARLTAAKLPWNEKVVGRADALWNHLGWAEKALRSSR